MQVTPPPLPPAPSAVAQPQTLVNALPHVITQAVTPISQKAIAPTPKGDNSQKSRRRSEQARQGASKDREGENRGEHVNISV